MDIREVLNSNEAILSVCSALTIGAHLDDEEQSLLQGIRPIEAPVVESVRTLILQGGDPLGDAYMMVNDAGVRRTSGSVYTPYPIVKSMVQWSSTQITPGRVVDCGCGSGRFSLMAARAFPNATIVAIDISPIATLMCKANAAAAGVTITVLRGNFTQVRIPSANGQPTLWIGNPPYVRHHGLTQSQKAWFLDTLEKLGVRGTGLAGLHAHFAASIANQFSDSDVGCLLMSAEWMDTNYGMAIRDILCKKLAVTYLNTYDKTIELFANTMSSAVVVGFAKHNPGGMVNTNGKAVPLSDYAGSSRWSDVVSGKRNAKLGDGFVRLGDYARVHRGVATGKNSFWIRRPGEVSEQLCTPVVSRARELAGNNPACRNVSSLWRLVTLPADLSSLPDELHEEAQGIIREGLKNSIDEGFVASHRKNWWSIKAPEPPAIMMTYMARHAPTFVVNSDRLGMLNVIHGIYPTVELSERAVAKLAEYLNSNVDISDGRMYSGGLAKFEPREVERLVVPSPDMLEGKLWE